MKPSLVIYCCANSTGLPEDEVEKCICKGEASIQMVRLPCSGRTDVLYIVQAIEKGADMALIVGCAEGECQYLQGNLRAKQRVGYANRVLNEVGLGLERVRMININPAQEGHFAVALQETIVKARELGPWLPS